MNEITAADSIELPDLDFQTLVHCLKLFFSYNTCFSDWINQNMTLWSCDECQWPIMSRWTGCVTYINLPLHYHFVNASHVLPNLKQIMYNHYIKLSMYVASTS